MQITPKIEFYKERSFSEKLNATIEFIRQNFTTLMKMILYFFSPVALLYGIITGLFIMEAGNMANIDATGQDPFAMMTYVGSYSVLLLIIGVVAISLFMSMTYNFIKIYNDPGEDNVDLNNLWKKSWPDVPKIIIYMIIAMAITVIGFFVFIIPGIYLAIVLSLGVAIMVYEDKGPIDALSRCFQLIKEKWFSTLGLLFVILILQYAVQALFSIPYYAMFFGQVFLSLQESPEQVMMGNMSTGYLIGFMLSIALLSFGSFCSYMLPQIGISYQYSNLVERQESKGLMQKIENLDTGSSKPGEAREGFYFFTFF